MQTLSKVLDVLVFSVLGVLIVYVMAFAIVGACLVGSQSVDCRHNVAGDMVYSVVSLAI